MLKVWREGSGLLGPSPEGRNAWRGFLSATVVSPVWGSFFASQLGCASTGSAPVTCVSAAWCLQAPGVALQGRRRRMGAEAQLTSCGSAHTSLLWL